MNLYDGYGNVIDAGNSNVEEYKNPNLVDTSQLKDTGYSSANPMYAEFGSATKYFDTLIDVSEKKDVYVRSVYNTSVTPVYKIACYEENGTYLYTLNYTEGYDYTSSMMRSILSYKSDAYNGCVYVQKYTFVDEVKSVKFSLGFNSYQSNEGRYTIYSYDDITALFALEEEYPANQPKSMLMIGDSLTNWAGGNCYDDGFLKIVHEKTGIIPTNEGTAGAWWQTGDGQDYCGVNRINTLISDGRKYDFYCIMLGTNQGSTTDTGETSADTTTMCGAIRYCIETLKAYEPTKPILICLPPQRAEGNENQERVNEVIKTIVESYGVKTLDIYHNGGIVPNTKIERINYLTDGLHLDVNGYTVLGNLLASEVAYLLGV